MLNGRPAADALALYSPSEAVGFSYDDVALIFREVTVDVVNAMAAARAFEPSSYETAQLLREFEQSATACTLRLARHLAAAPLLMPVMRMIERTLVPDAAPWQLSELIMSGLVRRWPGCLETRADDMEYEFLPGVRERLLEEAPHDVQWRTIDAVTHYVQRRFGRAREFLGYLLKGDGDQGTMPCGFAPFVRLATLLWSTREARQEAHEVIAAKMQPSQPLSEAVLPLDFTPADALQLSLSPQDIARVDRFAALSMDLDLSIPKLSVWTVAELVDSSLRIARAQTTAPLAGVVPESQRNLVLQGDLVKLRAVTLCLILNAWAACAAHSAPDDVVLQVVVDDRLLRIAVRDHAVQESVQARLQSMRAFHELSVSEGRHRTELGLAFVDRTVRLLSGHFGFASHGGQIISWCTVPVERGKPYRAGRRLATSGGPAGVPGSTAQEPASQSAD